VECDEPVTAAHAALPLTSGHLPGNVTGYST
jgi:hypothetical protein